MLFDIVATKANKLQQNMSEWQNEAISLQEVYEVKFLSDQAVAGSICRHDTGTKSIMNGCNVYDGRNHIFAAGLDDECHIYSVKYKVTSPEKKEKGKSILLILISIAFVQACLETLGVYIYMAWLLIFTHVLSFMVQHLKSQNINSRCILFIR